MERQDLTMSKVVNIGILIRNEHGDTFPVALNPQMVGVIQNLLMQIPVSSSKIVDGSGKKIASQTSIPIIPREIEFDWDKAYSPMEREHELDLMKKLNERYKGMAEAELTDGKISSDLEVSEASKKAVFEDPENPFNLELEATGKANEGMSEAEVADAMKTADQKLIDDAKYPEPIGQQEGEQIQQDVTVTPPALPLSGNAPALGGE